MSPSHSGLALVTGANRGIGFEVCRQLGKSGFRVFLAARDGGKAKTASALLMAEGLSVIPLTVDVTAPESIETAHHAIETEYGRLDVLVNNAGIHYDVWQKPLGASIEMVIESLQTNLLGAWRMCQAFVPLMTGSAHPRVVNVSSGAGSFGENPFGLVAQQGVLPAYGVSKAALNALTVKLAGELTGTRILVNAVCPGWTATYPGAAEQGARPVVDGAASVVWAALLPDHGPTGGFFRDGQRLPW